MGKTQRRRRCRNLRRDRGPAQHRSRPRNDPKLGVRLHPAGREILWFAVLRDERDAAEPRLFGDRLELRLQPLDHGTQATVQAHHRADARVAQGQTIDAEEICN